MAKLSRRRGRSQLPAANNVSHDVSSLSHTTEPRWKLTRALERVCGGVRGADSQHPGLEKGGWLPQESGLRLPPGSWIEAQRKEEV